MALNHSFSGKRILITGGGQGIGRTLVQRFHDDGAIVFTVDKNPESIQKLKQELPNVTAQVVDVADWDATRKVVESFGVLDHLVNNAGVLMTEPFLDISKEIMSTQFNVNLGATINVSQVMAKSLIAAGRGGSIVNIASFASRFGSTLGGGVYGATKAGVENLTKTMAIELGPHNIRVNAVSPGTVDTPILKTGGEPMQKHLANMIQRLVVKRWIHPNELADLVMFLLSPLSSMIVGESVIIDGGYLTS